MKIYLDLLPQQRKQEIHRSKRFRQILMQESFVLFTIVVFIVILLSINFILEIQKESIISQNAMHQSNERYQQLKNYEETFLATNSKVADLMKIQKNHFTWSNVLQKISDITTSGIIIGNLYTKNYQVFLVGKAKTRDDLLAFKDVIASDSCFENVNIPLSNLVNKLDVDFQMDFSVKQECVLDKLNKN